MPKIDPNNWLTTTPRCLKSYVEARLDLDFHTVVMSFGEADDLAREQPLETRIVHFEIDDIDNRRLGLGDGVVKRNINPNPLVFTLTEEEAQWHEFNFDIGLWVSDEMGGVTARLELYERLTDMLDGPSAEQAVWDETDIEIRSFRGGQFELEKIGDVRIYRVMGMELMARVAGRKVSAPMPYIDETLQSPGLDIGGEIIIG
jgi:hypothetical protein